MENTTFESKTGHPVLTNRIAHIVMCIGGLGFLFTKDFTMSVVFLGLSLAFDPFNAQKPWTIRPLWQKIYLLAVLTIEIILLVIDIFIKK